MNLKEVKERHLKSDTRCGISLTTEFISMINCSLLILISR